MLDYLAIPKPNAPSADDGVSWLQKASDWVTHLSADAWKLIVIGIFAAILYTLFRRSPLLKGVLLGAVLLAIVLAIAM